MSLYGGATADASLLPYELSIFSQELAARYLGITPRRFRQIHKLYRSTGNIPAIGVNLGRPKKEIPEEWKEIIKEEYGSLEIKWKNI